MPIAELVQTGALLRRSSTGEYWQATFGGEPALIIRFSPFGQWDFSRRLYATINFVQSARLQNSLAQTSQRWQTVLAIEATSADEAWAAYGMAEYSCDRLILSEITPDPHAMVRLVTEILLALKDAQSTSGRTHGNLAAEKILLSSREIAQARIWLTEPAVGRATPQEMLAADLRALGRLICELAAGRRWTPTVPLDPSMPEFKKLGPQWRHWASLARNLLEDNHSPDAIEKLLPRVAQLKPRPSRAPYVYAAAAAILLVLIGGLLYVRHRQEMERLARFNGAWAAYAKNYHGWFRQFTAAPKALSTSPALLPVYHRLQHRPVLNPDNILHEFTALLSDQKIQHDLAASPTASRRFGVAVVLLMRTERILGKLYPALERDRLAWRKFGWESPSHDLQSTVLSHMPLDPSLVPFLKLHKLSWAVKPEMRHYAGGSPRRVKHFLRALLAAQNVEADWTDLRHLLANLNKNPHRLVSGYRSYAVAWLKRCQSVAALGDSVKQLYAAALEAQHAMAKYHSRIQWSILARRPLPQATTPPQKYFPVWFNYCSIPRAKNALLANQVVLRKQIQRIGINIQRAMRLPKPPTVNYSALLQTYQKQIAAISSPTVWIEKNNAGIQATVGSVNIHLQTLNRAIVSYINSQINLKKWVSQLIGFNGGKHRYRVDPKNLRPFGIAAVNKVYLARIQQLVLGPSAPAKITFGPNMKSYGTILASLRARRWQVPQIDSQIHALHAALDQMVHTEFAIATVAPSHRIPPAEAARLLAATVVPARLAAIEVACRFLRFGRNEQIQMPQRIKALWMRQQMAYKQLVSDLGAVRYGLTHCELLGAAGPPPRTPAALYARLTRNLWWRNPTVRSTTRRLQNTVQLAVTISTAPINTIAALLAKSASMPPAWAPFLTRTAWQRLSSASLAKNPTLLPLEIGIAKKLQGYLRSAAPIQSDKALLQRMRVEFRHRWELRVNQATTARGIPTVIRSAPSYEVALKKIHTARDLKRFGKLNVRARYDLMFFTFTQQAAGIKNPAEAKATARRFTALLAAATAKPRYSAWKAYPSYQHLSAELVAVINANPAQTAQPSGPALAGWLETKLPGRERLFASPSGKRHLTFTLLRPPGMHSFYLCNQELRVGIFLHTVHSSENVLRRPASSFFNLIKYNTDYLGPHTWVYSRQTDDIAVAPSWFTNTNQIYGAPRFPAAIQAAAGKLKASAGGNPTRHDPVQYLPPKAAIYLAALLGCKIPSVGEWQFAYAQARSQKGASPHLPGRALAAYVAYLRTEDSSVDARLPTPRFWDIFGNSASQLRPYRKDYGGGSLARIFFRPVHASTDKPPFANLVGNVAEYTFNGGTPYRQQLKHWEKNPHLLTTNSVGTLLTTKMLRHFHVIGASALTPQGKISPAEPIKINWATRRAGRGFSDVGLRLAYNRRVLSPQQLLARLIRRNYYAYATP